MRTPRWTVILGCRNLGFAFLEREANLKVHILGWRYLRLVPERDANHNGAQSVWIGET
jgi:hypothetical protein